MNSRVLPDKNKQRSYDDDYMTAGKIAEEKIIAWLRERPEVIGIEDFRNIRAVHEADIDLGVKLMDGTVTLAELKSDWHMGKSGNVLFEILRINHRGPNDKVVTLGWSGRSPAIWLLIYAPQLDAIYRCKFEQLRSACQRYTYEAREKTRIDWVNTDNIKSTINILIPWKYCRAFFRRYDLNQNNLFSDL